MYISTGLLNLLLESDLEAAGWNGSKEPYPGQDPFQYACMSQAKSLTKKYLPGISRTTKKADEAALHLFLKTNDYCRDFDLDTQPRMEHEEEILGEIKLFLDRFFYPKPAVRWFECSLSGIDSVKYYVPRDFILSSAEIQQTVGVGPGASVGAKAADFFTKIATSALTFTDQTLLLMYKETIRGDPLWERCEAFRNNKVGSRLVSGSRLSFVPKTSEISRTICTEPILNMFFQKGIQGALERRLREVIGIDLSNQPSENALLARYGSITGEFGTIDLSSASDSLSINTVKRFFPARVFDLLMRFRSPCAVLPDGKLVELQMVSSMGNAFTFPLQTIFFSALVMSVYKILGIQPKHFRGRTSGSSNFAVFGDDIIVVKEAYDLVCRMLFLTGFTVNHDKSFKNGLFRESCGSDFYQGRSVRGVYLKTLNDVNDLYSAINRLNRWSAEHMVPLPLTIGFLAKRCRFLPVPFDEDDSAGIKVPYEIVSNRIFSPETGGTLYRYSKILPNRLSLPPKKQSQASEIGFFYNADGLMLAFLAGYIRNGSVGYRVDRRRAKIRTRWTSRWNFIASARGESCEFRDCWKAITAANLSKV
jgi:hypothetical protein